MEDQMGWTYHRRLVLWQKIAMTFKMTFWTFLKKGPTLLSLFTSLFFTLDSNQNFCFCCSPSQAQQCMLLLRSINTRGRKQDSYVSPSTLNLVPPQFSACIIYTRMHKDTFTNQEDTIGISVLLEAIWNKNQHKLPRSFGRKFLFKWVVSDQNLLNDMFTRVIFILIMLLFRLFLSI